MLESHDGRHVKPRRRSAKVCSRLEWDVGLTGLARIAWGWAVRVSRYGLCGAGSALLAFAGSDQKRQ